MLLTSMKITELHDYSRQMAGYYFCVAMCYWLQDVRIIIIGCLVLLLCLTNILHMCGYIIFMDLLGTLFITLNLSSYNKKECHLELILEL